jgi:hypothetical protein
MFPFPPPELPAFGGFHVFEIVSVTSADETQRVCSFLCMTEMVQYKRKGCFS